ncbi:sigma-70 family RNA polymerase sigma factor [Rhodobacteraceae bacterium W635]|uniref:sigma-70 family RNA polymerase sigma factor n=1 Tax=Nioella halotolerans TaxID=2303578 RepID=UPI000E3DC1BA|nr:sigma-70 family RNA polymerase sigma factor [Rhodobacteraceae bacterium W635]
MNKPILNWPRDQRRARRIGMLSAEDEKRLIAAWQRDGDSTARDRLLAAFHPMAIAMAKRHTPQSSEPDWDLVQQASIGLMKAADRFDPENGARFSTYAAWWMRAEIQDFKQANLSVVRRPNSAQFRKALGNLARLEDDLLHTQGVDRAEVDAHLARALGVSTERVGILREQVSGRDSSLNVPASGEDGEERQALLVDPRSAEAPGRIERLDVGALRGALATALAALPRREREIVVATQLQDPPATLEGLGAQLGISKERVRQLRERGFERLRDTLRKRDLTPEDIL